MVIESVFALPGLGSLLLTSVKARDLPIVQGTVFLMTATVLVMGLVVDVVQRLVDRTASTGMSAPLVEAAETIEALDTPVLRRPGWRSPSLVVGAALLLAVLLALALGSLLWSPYALDHTDPAARLTGPSAQHWAGTDRARPGPVHPADARRAYRVTVGIGLGPRSRGVPSGRSPRGLLAALRRPVRSRRRLRS